MKFRSEAKYLIYASCLLQSRLPVCDRGKLEAFLNNFKTDKMKTLIDTKRLILQEITFNDKAEMFQLHSHPDVQKYTGEPTMLVLLLP